MKFLLLGYDSEDEHDPENDQFGKGTISESQPPEEGNEDIGDEYIPDLDPLPITPYRKIFPRR